MLLGWLLLMLAIAFIVIAAVVIITGWGYDATVKIIERKQEGKSWQKR